MVTEFGTFVAVSAVVIMTPGPDTAMTVRNTLRGGHRTGVATALGVAIGQTLWTVAASAGIAALLITSEPVFRIVKLIGAGYLVALGLHGLYAAVRARGVHALAGDRGPRTAHTTPGRLARQGLRQGLVSNLGNPKMAVFFMSLLPQFVAPGSASFAGFLLLGTVFAMMTFGWLAAYVALVASTSAMLHRPAVRRVLDGLAGATLVALGIRLAVESP